MTRNYQLFIDGVWRDASNGETMPAINPYNQEVHGLVPVATVDDVGEAVAAARRAFDTTWSKTSPGERSRLLNKVADLLGRAVADRAEMHRHAPPPRAAAGGSSVHARRSVREADTDAALRDAGIEPGDPRLHHDHGTDR